MPEFGKDVGVVRVQPDRPLVCGKRFVVPSLEQIGFAERGKTARVRRIELNGVLGQLDRTVQTLIWRIRPVIPPRLLKGSGKPGVASRILRITVGAASNRRRAWRLASRRPSG